MISTLGIFDSLHEPVFAVDQNGIVVYSNDAAAALCNTNVKRLLRSKKQITELLNLKEKVSGLENLLAVQEALPYQEVEFENSDSQTVRIQISVQKNTLANETWLVFIKDFTLENTLQKKYRSELEQKESYISDLQKARNDLENYSKNLEKMVAERTQELSRLNGQMTALLDSLKQGFFIFDREGMCINISSKACEFIIETDPRNKPLHEVLKLLPKEIESTHKWIKTLFMDLIPFEDLATIGPQSYRHSSGLDVQLEYCPIRNSAGEIENVVVIATDVTELMIAQKEASKEKSFVSTILSLVKNRRQVKMFVEEGDNLLNDIKTLIQKTPINRDALFRTLHTFKGCAGTFGLADLIEATHNAEDQLADLKTTYSEENHLKVVDSCRLLPILFDHFKKDLLPKAGINAFQKDFMMEIPESYINEFFLELESQKNPLSHIFMTNFLLEPAAVKVGHYRETIEVTASRLDKKISELEITNGELLIFTRPYNTLFESLVHAIRNAVDHGIEESEHRLDLGKQAYGEIAIKFEHEIEELKSGKKEYLKITIADDGSGINPLRIRRKLEMMGYDHSSESDFQVIQHVFDPEFSTKEQITSLSGRGVGMDAIAENVKDLGGKYWVESEINKGTQVIVKVPWLLPTAANLFSSKKRAA